MITIREFAEEDWPAVWRFMEPVIRSGETYPYARDMDSAGAHHKWIEVTHRAYVAEDEHGEIVGSYYIAPNQPTLGAHVANCGYLVSESARGKGVASRMGEHSQEEAVRLVHIWKKLGFRIVGELEGAFRHSTLGYVDALVFYKVLVEE